jgi:hypothetical protein
MALFRLLIVHGRVLLDHGRAGAENGRKGKEEPADRCSIAAADEAGEDRDGAAEREPILVSAALSER